MEQIVTNNATKLQLIKISIKTGFLLDSETLGIFEQLYKIHKDFPEIILSTLRVTLPSEKRMLTRELFLSAIENVISTVKNQNTKEIEKALSFLETLIEEKSQLKKDKQKEENHMANIESKKTEKEEEIRNIKILISYNLKSKKFEVEDFVKYFRNRFNVMKSWLQGKTELENLTSINKISNTKQQFSIIGMINQKRETKNKNIMLEVEDLTGSAKFIVNSRKEDIFEKAKELVLDDVVGLRCSGNGEIFFVEEIVFPDIALNERRRLEQEEYAAFISDLHVGSARFLEDNFNRFIEWLNGKLEHKETAKKVKYLLVLGDTVDGVGVYPGQEELLNIKDIRKQYEKLAELLKKIREDITIVLCPGQHDAVRVAEPQPSLYTSFNNYTSPLYELKNLFLVSNPALVEIGSKEKKSGLKILMYHGASLHSIINDIDKLRIAKAHENPATVIKYLLKKRHLAPSHSFTTYLPAEEDSLLIKEVPDVIAIGEMHRPDIEYYNNILIINCSCWQSITPFEEKVGNHPDPCKVPLLNLKTGSTRILDFS